MATKKRQQQKQPTQDRHPSPSIVVPTTRQRLERILINLFLIVFLTLTTLDAWPSEWLDYKGTIENIQYDIDAILDMTGLWQGPWYLFSPNTPASNVHITATITKTSMYDRGRPVSSSTTPMAVQPTKPNWRSPNWYNMTWLEKKRHFRKQEYIDAVWQYDNEPLWKPLSDYVLLYEQQQTKTKTIKGTIDLRFYRRFIYGPTTSRKKNKQKQQDTTTTLSQKITEWLFGDPVRSSLGMEREFLFYSRNTTTPATT